jgi:O-acetyl-ADP-ribose deacetylase (regulator of RNase III)
MESLQEGNKRQLTSIAMPAISSGIFGFRKDKCAWVLFEAAEEFATS